MEQYRFNGQAVTIYTHQSAKPVVYKIDGRFYLKTGIKMYKLEKTIGNKRLVPLKEKEIFETLQRIHFEIEELRR